MKSKNTAIVATNSAEYSYLKQYCKKKKVFIPNLADNYIDFPIALSLNGNGGTDSMDKALNYITFKDFIVDQAMKGERCER